MEYKTSSLRVFATKEELKTAVINWLTASKSEIDANIAEISGL